MAGEQVLEQGSGRDRVQAVVQLSGWWQLGAMCSGGMLMYQEQQKVLRRTWPGVCETVASLLSCRECCCEVPDLCGVWGLRPVMRESAGAWMWLLCVALQESVSSRVGSWCATLLAGVCPAVGYHSQMED